MTKRLKAITVVSPLLAAMLAAFTAKVFVSLPELQPSSTVTVGAYTSLLKAFELVSLWVLPAVAVWLCYTSAVLWRHFR